MKGDFGNESGSVMLEVVMTLPLHLVMLLTTIWLGMMCVDHTYVEELDYANAVTLANRDSSLTSPLETYRALLYQNGSHVTVSDEGGGASGATWACKTTSKVKLTQQVPGWLGGIDAAVKYCMHLGEEETSVITCDYGTVAMDMYAQGAAGNMDLLLKNASPTTTVVSRNGSGYTTDRSSSQDWSGIVHESYPDGHAPTSYTQKTVSSYTRNTTFSKWSGKN